MSKSKGGSALPVVIGCIIGFAACFYGAPYLMNLDLGTHTAEVKAPVGKGKLFITAGQK